MDNNKKEQIKKILKRMGSSERIGDAKSIKEVILHRMKKPPAKPKK